MCGPGFSSPPPRPLPQRPPLCSGSLSLVGGGDPALQTKVNCSSFSWAWPMHSSGPAASACSVCTDLGGLPLFDPLEEWQRPVGEWECQGGTEKAAHLYLGLAGIWRGPRGSWILPLDLVLTKAHRLPGFLFFCLHPFIFPPSPLFVFH